MKVKYKDDGREIVSWYEYVTIHTTFPFINAWMTYTLFYQFTLVVLLECPYDNRFDEDVHLVCHNGNPNAQSKGEYQYNLLINYAKSFYLFILIESIYGLAYFKDIAFCFFVGVEYCGMFFFSKENES